MEGLVIRKGDSESVLEVGLYLSDRLSSAEKFLLEARLNDFKNDGLVELVSHYMPKNTL